MFILSVVPIALTGAEGNVNPSDRLAEIRSKIAVSEQRVRDLEGLLTSLILGEQFDADPTTTAIDQVSGVPYHTPPTAPGAKPRPPQADPNEVRQELYRARAEEGELRTAENFWNEIVTANKTAEQKTHELFKQAG